MSRTLRLDDWARSRSNRMLMRGDFAEQWTRNNLQQGTFPRGHKGKVRSAQACAKSFTKECLF